MHHRHTVGLDIPCQVAHLQSLTPLLQCLRVGTATRRADSSGSPSESRAGKGTATQAHRKDVSGARVRMPLKNQKEKIRASPWKICFDFFLLIGGKGTATQAHRKDVSGARVRMP